MRIIAACALVLAAAAAVVIGVRASDGGGGDYQVRAIFDSAGFAQKGMDVKVAGVVVGAIDSVEVTEDFKAAVVLDINEEGFQDFRRDATCIIRPQSLIGEKFVECEPTQQRPAGAEPPPELEEIAEGDGKGQRLLPVGQTQRSVDLDLINNIMRLPYRQRLSIILSELGATVAGRGEDLDDVIARANPALRETGEVLKILAGQNETLASLARDSDQALAPLARERRRVSSFIANAAEVGAQTAAERDALEATIERLPEFLRQLKPTMTRLGALAGEMSPVLSDLGDVAPDINRFILELGPFSTAAVPALESLGETADVGREALQVAEPVLRDTRDAAKELKPAAGLLAELLESVERTGTIEEAMRFIYHSVSAINGFDAFGHYLRAALIVDQCATYAITPTPGCRATFGGDEEALAAAASGPRDAVLERTAAVLRGEDPEDVLARAGLDAQPRLTPAPVRDEPVEAAQPDPAEPVLDYLLGSDG